MKVCGEGRPGLVTVTFRQLSPEQIANAAKKAGLQVLEWGGDVHVPAGDTMRARSDNGSEFIAYATHDWMEKASIKTICITPGSPWENGHIESFHDKLRDECLNRELFGSLLEARVILESWRIEYNESRPHSSLGYQTPGEFARRSNSGLQSLSGLPTPGVAINTNTNHKIQPAELQI